MNNGKQKQVVDKELQFYIQRLMELKHEFPNIYRHFIALLKAMLREMDPKS